MNTIKLRSQAGEDGVLTLRLPIGLKNTVVDVIVIFQTVVPADAMDDNGWPVDFFSKTAGSIPDFPLDADEGFSSTDYAIVTSDHNDEQQR